MFKRSCVWALLFLLVVGSRGQAGVFSTLDTEEETGFSPSFEKFTKVLFQLRAVPVLAPANPPPMHRRYVLIEKLAGGDDFRLERLQLKSSGFKKDFGDDAWLVKLQELELKLNYSTVLIRRNKADKAADILLVLKEEHPDNFVILAQCAAALFLSKPEPGNRLRSKAGEYLEEALKKWPHKWEDVPGNQRDFLQRLGWNSVTFEHHRRYEVCFHRLVVSRLKEEERGSRKKNAPATLDPIFNESKEKPIRFVNDKGEFEPGRIPKVEKDRLPHWADAAVEQLLIWMPNDLRLLWLLAEVLNARAMDIQRDDARIEAILNAKAFFEQLDKDGNLSRTKDEKYYGEDEVKARLRILSAYEQLQQKRNEADPEDLLKKIEDTPAGMTNEKLWQMLGLAFVTGIVVGIFAVWQVQEFRRRRAARAP